MKNGIRALIRQIIHRHVTADDPLPPGSWLDEKNVPRQQRNPNSPVSGLPVAQVPPLRGRHSAFPHLQSSGRLKGRRAVRVHRAADAPIAKEKL